MTIGSIEPVPEGFLARLLNEFGLQWTHLVILSGVVFSSFRLEAYLNPGIWILGTVLAFALVYLFRHYVSHNFPKVALFACVTITAAVALPLSILGAKNIDVASFMKSQRELSTIYLATVSAVPLGVAILSYRKQEEFLRTPLPNIVVRALNESVHFTDFIHHRVEYIIDLTSDSGSDVILKCNATMSLVNRTKRRATYRDIFDPAGREQTFFSASINGIPVDVEDPERLSQRGLQIDYECQPGEHFDVNVVLQSRFYRRDSEFVGTYFPCEALSVHVRPSKDLRVNVQSLLRNRVDLKRLGSGEIAFEYLDGVLPFQGTRIFWEPATRIPASAGNQNEEEN